MCSFAFLSDKYVILAHMTPPLENGALTVMALTGESSTCSGSRRLIIEIDGPEDQETLPDVISTDKRWTFLLPPCQTESSAIESMELLCDPGPQCMPNAQKDIPSPAKSHTESSKTPVESNIQPESQPPFFLARDERIVILMLTVMDDHSPYLDPYTIRFTISSAHLLAYIHGAPSSPPLPWTTWGPESCRAEPRNDIWDGSWPCCLHGTRFAVEHSYVVHTDARVRRYRPVSLDPNDYEIVSQSVELYDFNQAEIRRAVGAAGVVPADQSLNAFFESKAPVSYQDVEPLVGISDGFEYYVHPTRLPPDFAKFFDDADCVQTHLPYRTCNTRISMNKSDNGYEAYNSDGVGADDPPVDVGIVSAVMLSEDTIIVVRVSAHDVTAAMGCSSVLRTRNGQKPTRIFSLSASNRP